MVSDGRANPRTLSSGSISSSILERRSTRSNSQSPFRSHPSRTYRANERGARPPRRTSDNTYFFAGKGLGGRTDIRTWCLWNSTPTTDNGGIRGVVNQGTYLDFDQHCARRCRVVERRARVAGVEVGVGWDAEAERRFSCKLLPYATQLFPTRDVTRI